MTTFSYTSGDPGNLVGGANADMADIKGPFDDLENWLNGQNITDSNVQAAGIGFAKLTPLVLYGTVNGSTGGIAFAGSGGWTSSKGGAGAYTVFFSPNFSAAPMVVATPNVAAQCTIFTLSKTGASIVFNTIVPTNGGALDANVDFVAIGLR